MTLSLLARAREAGCIGGATMTGGLAVGAWVLHARAGLGVVATQGYSTNPLWGEAALDLLADGMEARTVSERLAADDPGRQRRQLAVLGLEGEGAVWTGRDNEHAMGAIIRPDFVVAGNWLASRDVLDAAAEPLAASRPVLRRLVEGLKAGVDAGGDARGVRSAAIRVVARDRPPLDLRVDFHDEPVAALSRLVDLWCEEPFASLVRRVPTLEEPFKC